jgi:enterochelin esterase family protein
MHFDGNLTNISNLSDDGNANGNEIIYSDNSLEGFGQCIELDGSSYLTVPHHPSFNLSGDWTIEAWIKVTAFNPGIQSIIVRKPGDNDEYFSSFALELNPWWGNVLHGYYFTNNDNRKNVIDSSPELDQWYHVSFTRDQSNSEIKIIVHDQNWNQVSSNSRTFSDEEVLLNNQDIRIGEAFEGYIDELRISNVVREPKSYLKLTAPSAEDSLKAGNNFQIRWISEGIEQVKLEYRETSSEQWQLIDDQISADDGIYLWSVPIITTDQCQVRISDPSDSSIYDISDGTFNIGSFGSGSNILARENVLLYYNEGNEANAEMVADVIQDRIDYLERYPNFIAVEENIYTFNYCKDIDEFNSKKPNDVEDFKTSYTLDGEIYFVEPITTEQSEIFENINQAALFGLGTLLINEIYGNSLLEEWLEYGFASFQADVGPGQDYLKSQVNDFGRKPVIAELNDWENISGFDKYAFAHTAFEFIALQFGYHSYLPNYSLNFEQNVYNFRTIEGEDEFNEVWHTNLDLFYLNDTHLIKKQGENESFIFYMADEDLQYLDHFDSLMTDTYQRYKSHFGAELRWKLNFYIFPSICEYSYSKGLDECDRWTQGESFGPDIFQMYTPREKDNDSGMDFIAMHEFSHSYNDYIAPIGSIGPGWFSEGFAMFMPGGLLTDQQINQMKTQVTEHVEGFKNRLGGYPNAQEMNDYEFLMDNGIDDYLMGHIILDFIVRKNGFEGLKAYMESGYTNYSAIGHEDADAFISGFFDFYELTYKNVELPSYFKDYDEFIAQLTMLTQSTDKAAELDNFWDELTSSGNFPFAIDNQVAFLYRGEANTVSWAGDFNSWDPNADMGVRLGVSDIWLLEKEFPSDARTGYKIVLNGSEWIADEHNPYPETAEWGNSDLRMPDYEIPEETIIKPSVPKGELSDNILIFSSNLNYDCQYRVYTPAGYDDMTDLPVIFVTDGFTFSNDSLGKMKTILDNLIYDEKIKPTIAVFLDPRDPDNLSFNRRSNEYRNNINFVNYVTQELIPEIDAAYKTSASATDRAIAGYSYGGYNAAYFCAMAGDYIKNTAILSPIIHPNPPDGGYNIYDDLMAADLTDTKIYMSYGIFDTREVRYFNDLEDIFNQKNKEFKFDIVNQGHTLSNWSSVIGNALQYFFSENYVPAITDIPDQTIDEGDAFTVIPLDDYITDVDNTASEINWTFSGNNELNIEIDATRIATISAPSSEWNGTETVTFTATDPHGANVSDEVVFTVNEKTAINEPRSALIYSIYPNPASTKVTITVPEEVDLKIFTISGQKVLQEKISKNKTINVNHFQKGIYIALFTSNNETRIHKFIIENKTEK